MIILETDWLFLVLGVLVGFPVGYFICALLSISGHLRDLKKVEDYHAAKARGEDCGDGERLEERHYRPLHGG